MPTASLRPALAALAAAPTSTTVRKLWKALSAEERSLAISAAMTDDPEGWVKNTTRAAVARALRFRPQTVSTWPRQKLVAEAVRLPLDDAQLLSAYIVDLHLGHRRPMMRTFLDALGIPNEDGRIDSESVEVPAQDPARITAAAAAIAATYPADEVATYFLTLLLQDADVWGGVAGWLEGIAGEQAPR
ncbi:MAG: hypothetical protein JWL60_1512 [Gemmatimonadetes bacterium]|jgi:hypothetical protein|nr:hypothetical protein [Gemmatimonadota bacterium]